MRSGFFFAENALFEADSPKMTAVFGLQCTIMTRVTQPHHKPRKMQHRSRIGPLRRFLGFGAGKQGYEGHPEVVLPVLPGPIFAVAPNVFKGLRDKTTGQIGVWPVPAGEIAL